MNRLATETSPYLLQHQADPIDWFPWGAEAFDRARERNVPVLLSIGYSTCHWCHVMARESFSDPSIGEVVDGGFVAIKVDREERPDLDAVYGAAARELSGVDGWPLTVFCAPDGSPFFAGGYFPSRETRDRPAFGRVLAEVRDAWIGHADEIAARGKRVTEAIAAGLGSQPSRTEFGPGDESATAAVDLVRDAVAEYVAGLDDEFGGFGLAPKFPQAPILELLLAAHIDEIGGALEAAEQTLMAIASGAINDQIGGGFHRYTLDRQWNIPHFEKMLVDQASLGRVYLHAWQMTGDPRYRQVVSETVAYVLAELRAPDGGYWTAQDADSPVGEGAYYTWTDEEFTSALGADTQAAAAWYGLRSAPRIQHARATLRRARRGDLIRPPQIDKCRTSLRLARAKRSRPNADTKRLTEANAMLCSFLAEAGRALDNDAWCASALELGEYLVDRCAGPNDRVMRTCDAPGNFVLGLATDYGWLIECFTRLYECSGSRRWLDMAIGRAEQLLELFSADDGGFYLTGADAPMLIVRPRDVEDTVTPSATSIAVTALSRLAALTDRAEFAHRAERTIATERNRLRSSPLSVASLLLAARVSERGPIQVRQVGTDSMLRVAAGATYLPDGVISWHELEVWAAANPQESAGLYVCADGRCFAPAGTAADFRRTLELARKSTFAAVLAPTRRRVTFQSGNPYLR